MSKEKKKSWFRKHWFLTGFGGLILLIIIIAAFSGDTSYNSNELILTDSKNLLPQENEIDREWILGSYDPLNSTDNGFIEGTMLKIIKKEAFSATVITMKVYRFGSFESASSFYNKEIQTIDIRGVKEWNLGTNCFGIDKEALLGGNAKAYCLKENVVMHVESASNSFLYAIDGKDFMKIMLKKI